MLSAFLPKKELISIFGQNLLERDDLIEVYKELLGISKVKPFDCVGTSEEVCVAFFLSMQKGEYEQDPIMKFFQQDVLPKIPDIDRLKEQVFENSEKHSIPEEFKEVLRT